MSRRGVLGALAGVLGLGATGCRGAAGDLPTPTGASGTSRRIAYGPGDQQFGELHLPAGNRRPGVVVIVHGGFWRSEYGLDLGTPLAADLARRGRVAWNIEYRRVGSGGGWPATFDDVSAAVDHLAVLAKDPQWGDIDLGHVVMVGHSAGGHLAAWLAARSLPGRGAGVPGRDAKVRVTGVVSQAGVLDLATAQRTGVGGSAVEDLLGGDPTSVPDRYADADPIRRLPLGLPVHCVHSPDDQNVPYAQSTAYVAAAKRAGDPATLHTVAGDHFTLIDPTSKAWGVVVDLLPGLCGG